MAAAISFPNVKPSKLSHDTIEATRNKICITREKEKDYTHRLVTIYTSLDGVFYSLNWTLHFYVQKFVYEII